MRKFLSAAFKCSLVLAVLAMVPACKTVEGAGKDIENAGEGIKDAAD